MTIIIQTNITLAIKISTISERVNMGTSIAIRVNSGVTVYLTLCLYTLLTILVLNVAAIVL